MKEKARPGVMLYFDDIMPYVDYMKDETLGALTRAIMKYAQYGEWVDVDCDQSILVPLLVMKPKLDRDAKAYENKRIHGKYMAYVRREKADGREALPENEWRAALAEDEETTGN